MGNDIKMEAESKTSKVEKNLVRPRRTLADISNLPQQHQVVTTNPLSKEYVERLQKENMMLMKALTERNKIIELSEIEIQKLKVSLQIMQQQNVQLARANTQMLADLNSGKDRLKVLQHELGCKNALLKMRNLEMEENAKDRVCHSKEPKPEIAETSYTTDKPCGTRRKQRSKSQCPTSVDQVQANEIVDSKRQCKRRQSARFRMEEPSDIGKNNSPPQHVATTDESPISNSSIKKENEEEKCTPGVEDLISRRSSIARPSRRAAAKVQSYKEIPLNVKMRRAS